MKSKILLLAVCILLTSGSYTFAQRRDPREAAILGAFMDENYQAVIDQVDSFLDENPGYPKTINMISLKARCMYMAKKDRKKSYNTLKQVLEMDGRFKKQVWSGVATFYSKFEGKLDPEEVDLALEAGKKSGNPSSLFAIVSRVKSDIKSLKGSSKNEDKELLGTLEKKIKEYGNLKAPKVPVRSPFSGKPSRVKNPLSLGDKLPAIGNRATWLKGEEVPEFQSGKIYVIDLWATWCGPCIAAMPHVSKLADKYKDKDVVVIGLAFDPKTATPTDEFVEKNEKKIRYRICEDIEQKLHKDYFQRLNLAGIPTILIVDEQGRLAWLGHPNNMDQPLEEIVKGTYDLEKAKAEMKKFQQKPRNNGRNNGANGRGGNRGKGSNLKGLIDNIFEKADKDKDGFLTKEELSNTFADNGRLLFDPRRLSGSDANGDGKFSKEEVMKSFSNRRRRR